MVGAWGLGGGFQTDDRDTFLRFKICYLSLIRETIYTWVVEVWEEECFLDGLYTNLMSAKRLLFYMP